MACFSAAISFASCAFSASLLLIVAPRFSNSSFFSSRSLIAAAISVSQKLLVVASAPAWSSSLLMMSLMIVRTFTKWSFDSWTFRAATERAGLLRWLAAPESNARTSSRTAAGSKVRRLLPRNCRKEAGRRDSAATATAPVLTCSLRCRPTSFLLAEYFGTTPVLSLLIASLMAVSSSARVLDRWSQAVAFSSQLVVSTFRKFLSAL
mmetsp:Transcript_68240/g.154468  ORF Transcript_68240/g.154468 Transcript_68240/m.154468 type:complete len:207 (-) Transcript_68240:906-1526(-)